MLNNYLKYLNMLDEKLNQFFEKQKPYIFCKKGCAKCCKNARYPFSEIEFQYLITGYKTLPENTKQKICSNIKNILEKKNINEDFNYQCPFLIDDICSIYKYRGIICRTFGLLNTAEPKGTEIPFCTLEGLNYSNVYDTKERRISEKMFAKLHIQQEPIVFNVRYDFLTSQDFGNSYGFKFGEVQPLIKWLEKSEIFSKKNLS